MDKAVLGQTVKRLRKELGLTQADLASKSGVSSRSIQDIEAGNANPTVEAVESLGLVLGANLFPPDERPIDRPKPSELSLLIEAPQSARHSTVTAVLERLLGEAPEVRAAVLAVLYGDTSIAAPYARAGKAKAK